MGADGLKSAASTLDLLFALAGGRPLTRELPRVSCVHGRPRALDGQRAAAGGTQIWWRRRGRTACCRPRTVPT